MTKIEIFNRHETDENEPNFKFYLDASQIKTIRDRVAEYPQITYVEPPYHVATNSRLSLQEKLQQIQNYIQRLEYNYTGMQFFDLNASRPICGLMGTARHMYEKFSFKDKRKNMFDFLG